MCPTTHCIHITLYFSGTSLRRLMGKQYLVRIESLAKLTLDSSTYVLFYSKESTTLNTGLRA